MYDVIIVGGGPAGLSAALVLGRCRRHVLVCDTGRPRNAASHGLHGFLTRDGILPSEFLRIGREELSRYRVEMKSAEVTEATRNEQGFEVCLSDRTMLRSRMLLIATGVVDELPSVEGVRELYGKGVFHCPYCDGWEVRDQPLAVYGKNKQGAGLALSLKTWSGDIMLFTDGPSEVRAPELARLKRHTIRVREERVLRLEGKDGVLTNIVLDGGERVERKAMFFSTGQHQRCGLAEKLGCKFNDKGAVRTARDESSGPGLYVAGDASHDVQFVIVAAAEGARAAVAINKALQATERA